MTYRAKALAIAKGELGVRESPRNSNRGPRVDQYLKSAGWSRGVPWCMAFVHWCFRRAGLVLSYPNLASVGFFEDWGRKNGYLVTEPRPGDVVCYRFDADNWPDHVGIVEHVYPTALDVIEGNTAVGNDANGGMVMRRRRPRTRTKYVRIPGAPKPAVRKPSITNEPLEDAIDRVREEDRPWPKRIPGWFWGWAAWKLGDRPGPRPKDAPKRIGPKHWAWRRLAAFKKARSK